MNTFPQLANRRKVNDSGLSGPVCLGSGLVTLDVICDGEDSHPLFLAGGSCYNVLAILSYLGWNSFPMARLGTDPEGDMIVEDMKRWGVKTSFVDRSSDIRSPQIIERIRQEKNPRHRFYLKCKHGSWLPQRRRLTIKLFDRMLPELPKPDVFYFDRADPSALKAATLFKEQGSVIIFEPPRMFCNDNFIRCLEVADIVKHCHRPSYVSAPTDEKIHLEIQTKGEEGLRYRAKFLNDAAWKIMGALPAPRLVDDAGSGDWLTAGMIYTLWNGSSMREPSEMELERSLRFGQALASLNCCFYGARGMMYCLESSRLIQMAGAIIAGGLSPTDLPPVKSNALPTSHPEYRMCFCREGWRRGGCV